MNFFKKFCLRIINSFEDRKISPEQFALFRIVFGFFLIYFFTNLILEKRSLPETFISRYVNFPNILTIYENTYFEYGFISLLIIFSFLILIGLHRKKCAYFVMYGFVCLYRDDQIFPFLCFSILFMLFAIIPEGEGFFLNKKNERWQFPKYLFTLLWIFLTFVYTSQGISEVYQKIDSSFNIYNTYDLLFIFVKIIFIFFIFSRKSQAFIWSVMLIIQLCSVLFSKSTIFHSGIFLFHLFMISPNWFFSKEKRDIIIFFDGVCHLCEKFICFLINTDQQKIYKYSPLQGKTARIYLDPKLISNLNTVVVKINDQTLTKSSAIFFIFSKLGGVWYLISLLRFMPVKVTDYIYQVVSKYRFYIFGKNEICFFPKDSESEKFID